MVKEELHLSLEGDAGAVMLTAWGAAGNGHGTIGVLVAGRRKRLKRPKRPRRRRWRCIVAAKRVKW